MQSVSLAIIGMVTLDLVYVTKSHPREDSENAVLAHTTAVGGPAGRSSVAAGRLGGDVRLLAMIGTGTFADLLKTQVRTEPFTATWIETGDDSQHSCVLVSDDSGLRTTVWLPQPRANDDMLSRLDGFITGARTVLLDCTDETLTRQAVKTAHSLGATIVMDTGSYKHWVDDVLPSVDHIIVPEKFLRKRFSGISSAKDAAVEAFRLFKPKVFGVTQGSHGGFWLDESGRHEYQSYCVDTVDTCGAGDTFHGAYAWALSAGYPLAMVFGIAAWSAGRKCAALGNGTIPGREELISSLDELRQSHRHGPQMSMI